MAEDLKRKILEGDISSFIIPAQLTNEDKKSLLAIQQAVHKRQEKYAYLEIGSYLGGSLQSFLVDDLCTEIYSIDKRPVVVPDERGLRRSGGVTKERMLEELRKFYQDHLWKLKCIDEGTGQVDKAKIEKAPILSFIDGEHTNQASFNDFLFCLSVAQYPSIIVFHDVQICFAGIEKSLRHLQEKNIPYYAYVLPDFVCVVEVGQLGILRDERVFGRVSLSALAILKHLKSTEVYRSVYVKVTQNPLYVLGRKLKAALTYAWRK